MKFTALWKLIVPATILSLGLIVLVFGPLEPSATDSMTSTDHSMKQAASDTPNVAVEVYNDTAMAQRDAKITARVNTALHEKSAIEHSYIHVRTMAGVVMLTGRVPSDAVIARAERLTQSTAGVREVDNKLMVSDNEPINRPVGLVLEMVLAVLSQSPRAAN
jgi:hypothetical protein